MEIDPLQLETYFIKAKRVSEISGFGSNIQTVDGKGNQFPTKDEVSKYIKNFIPKSKFINIETLIKSDYFEVRYEKGGDESKTLYFGEVNN